MLTSLSYHRVPSMFFDKIFYGTRRGVVYGVATCKSWDEDVTKIAAIRIEHIPMKS